MFGFILVAKIRVIKQIRMVFVSGVCINLCVLMGQLGTARGFDLYAIAMSLPQSLADCQDHFSSALSRGCGFFSGARLQHRLTIRLLNVLIWRSYCWRMSCWS